MFGFDVFINELRFSNISFLVRLGKKWKLDLLVLLLQLIVKEKKNSKKVHVKNSQSKHEWPIYIRHKLPSTNLTRFVSLSDDLLDFTELNDI